MDEMIKKIEEKKIIVVSLFLIIGLILLIVSIPKGVDTKTKSDSFRHREEGIVKEEEYKGIKLTNIKMITEDGYTTFKATATNVSEEDIKLENFYDLQYTVIIHYFHKKISTADTCPARRAVPRVSSKRGLSK